MSIEIKDLSKHYGATKAVDGVSLLLDDSVQVLGLIGPSGGGKSTFLRLLGGLEIPTTGFVKIDGNETPHDEEALRKFRLHNGFLFQSFNLFPHLSALENIVLPLIKVHDWNREDATDRAQEVVRRFGLAKHVTKMPAELSGGQQQRIALARAMAHDPAILLLDEPTSALDPEMKAEVLDVVEELRQSGQRLVLSTHEMSFARHSANHVVFLADGKIVESGTSDELFGNPKSEQVRGFLDRVMKW